MPFLSPAGWLRRLRIGADEVPELVVLEGTWWAADKAPARLGELEGVRELALPGIYHGWHDGAAVAFCFVYGAPRAVEPVHIFGEIGSTPKVLLIGSCGGIAPQVRTGDIVLPDEATIEESTSAHYRAGGGGASAGGGGASAGGVSASPTLLAAGAESLERQGRRWQRGTTVTTSALLTQHRAQIERWATGGHLAVDLETSAVYSAATHFGMEAAALLFCWDELSRGRSWLDTFTPAEVAAQRAADRATYSTALEIGCGAHTKETQPWN